MRADDDLSSTAPNADLIGAEYRVVSNDVLAYGIYKGFIDLKNVGVILITPHQQSGPEIAFVRRIPAGQVVKILRAGRRYVAGGSYDYYVVELPGAELPADIPIRIDLNRGNVGEGVDLNSSFYAKLSKRH
jgi:hypothetical protein